MSELLFVIKDISKLLVPLGITPLASLAVILLLNEFKKYGYAKKQKVKKGGSVTNIFNVLVKTIAPLGKNNLLALASILLLNYFMTKVNSKDNKVKQGGVMIGKEISKLLMPLGVNNMGASIIILILLYIVNKKKKMIGGGDSKTDTSHLNNLKRKLMKCHPDSFKSLSLFGGAAALFDRKIYGSSSGIKVSVKKLRDNLKKELQSLM